MRSGGGGRDIHGTWYMAIHGGTWHTTAVAPYMRGEWWRCHKHVLEGLTIHEGAGSGVVIVAELELVALRTHHDRRHPLVGWLVIVEVLAHFVTAVTAP